MLGRRDGILHPRLPEASERQILEKFRSEGGKDVQQNPIYSLGFLSVVADFLNNCSSTNHLLNGKGRLHVIVSEQEHGDRVCSRNLQQMFSNKGVDLAIAEVIEATSCAYALICVTKILGTLKADYVVKIVRNLSHFLIPPRCPHARESD